MSYFGLRTQESEWVTGDRVLYKKQLGTLGVDRQGHRWFQPDDVGGEIVRVAIYEQVRPPLVSGQRVRWGGDRDPVTKKFREGTITIVDNITAVHWDGDAAFTPPLTPNQVAMLLPIGTFDTHTVDAKVAAEHEKAAKEKLDKEVALQKKLSDQATIDKEVALQKKLSDQATIDKEAALQKNPPATDETTILQQLNSKNSASIDAADNHALAEMWFIARLSAADGGDRESWENLVKRAYCTYKRFEVAPALSDRKSRVEYLLKLISKPSKELTQAVFGIRFPSCVLQEIQFLSCEEHSKNPLGPWYRLNQAAVALRGLAGYDTDKCKTFPVPADPLARIEVLLGRLPVAGTDNLRVAVADARAAQNERVLEEMWDLSWRIGQRDPDKYHACQKLTAEVRALRLTEKVLPEDYAYPANPFVRMNELLALVPNASVALREAVAALSSPMSTKDKDEALLQEMQDSAARLGNAQISEAITKARGGVATLTNNPVNRTLRELLNEVSAQVPYRWAMEIALNNFVAPTVTPEATMKTDDTLKDMQSIAFVTAHGFDVFKAITALRDPNAVFHRDIGAINNSAYDASRLVSLELLFERLPDVEQFNNLRSSLQALRTKRLGLQPTPTPLESTTMPEETKPSVTSRIKTTSIAVGKDAAWRVLALQIVRTARDTFTAGIRAKMKNNKAMQRQIIRALESPWGEAALGAGLSVASLAFMPQSAKRDRLAHEFAVGAATLFGNDTINTFLDPFRTFVTDVVPAMMASLPEPEPLLAETAGEKVAEKVE